MYAIAHWLGRIASDLHKALQAAGEPAQRLQAVWFDLHRDEASWSSPASAGE